MRKAVVIGMALALLGQIGSVAAQPPVGDDLVGLWCCPDFSEWNPDFVYNPGGPFDLYLLLTGATAAPVTGFECALAPDAPMLLLAAEFPVKACNARSLPELAVTFGEPVPATDGVVLLGTMTYLAMVWPEMTVHVYLTPITDPSCPQSVCYRRAAVGPGADPVVTMTPVGGSFDVPVFVVNPLEGPAVEPAAWSDIRRLFR